MADSDQAPEPDAQVEQPVNQSLEQSVSTPAGRIVTSRAGRTLQMTTEEQAVALIGLVEDGVSVRQAATQLGLNLRTAFSVLARSDADVESIRAVMRRLMAAQALDRVEDWRVASEVGARKKGNHAPARDWLLHAGVIDAVDNGNVSVRVAINIGTEDRPMHVASPQDVVVEVPPEKG